MTIGELARRAGLTQSAIRYYERVGLLRADGRTAGNYRTFQATAVERLRFIRAAQASGLSLEDVRALLSFQDGTMTPCVEVRALVEARLTVVDQQMKHLRDVQKALKAFRDACAGTEAGTPCPVLEELGGQSGA